MHSTFVALWMGGQAPSSVRRLGAKNPIGVSGHLVLFLVKEKCRQNVEPLFLALFFFFLISSSSSWTHNFIQEVAIIGFSNSTQKYDPNKENILGTTSTGHYAIIEWTQFENMSYSSETLHAALTKQTFPPHTMRFWG